MMNTPFFSLKFYKNPIEILENPDNPPQIYPKFTPNFIKFTPPTPPSPPLPPPNLGKNGPGIISTPKFTKIPKPLPHFSLEK